jgi:molybdopterin-binding protein
LIKRSRHAAQRTQPDPRHRRPHQEGIVTAEVIVRIAGGHEIASVITVESITSLKLKKGSKVIAVIKSTEVMIGIDH